MADIWELLITPAGHIRTVYTEAIDLPALGALHLRRASHVEPDAQGRWWADLAPVGGPHLGPYTCRSQSIRAESDWLIVRLGDLPPPE